MVIKSLVKISSLLLSQTLLTIAQESNNQNNGLKAGLDQITEFLKDGKTANDNEKILIQSDGFDDNDNEKGIANSKIYIGVAAGVLGIAFIVLTVFIIMTKKKSKPVELNNGKQFVLNGTTNIILHTDEEYMAITRDGGINILVEDKKDKKKAGTDISVVLPEMYDISPKVLDIDKENEVTDLSTGYLTVINDDYWENSKETSENENETDLELELELGDIAK
eukprot:Awhi_evm1s10670